MPPRHGRHDRHGHRRGPTFGRRHGRGPRWGLRRRLTLSFAFVALVAVGLTTWLTLGAVLSAQEQLFQTEGAAPDRTADLGEGRGPPWFRGGDGRGQDVAAFEPAQEAFHRIRGTAFVAALLSSVLAIGMAAIVTRFLTHPLLALTEGARQLEVGERGIRLRVPPGHDELRGLTLAFNNLVAGLERQEAWRRDLVADVAHDLRTPLAVMRSEIEAMQDGLVSVDAAGLERLHAKVMMLSRLVDDLRTLSLAEGGGLSLKLEPTELGPLLARAVETFGSRAAQAGVELRLEPVPDGLAAMVDPGRLMQLLGNLLDNALRYAGPGLVEVGAGPEEGQGEEGVRLWVRDHGPGLPTGAEGRVFERFYRGDPSRARERSGSEDGGGSGLGLAIARAIALAHGGRLEAANHPAGGAEFTLHLPAVRGEPA